MDKNTWKRIVFTFTISCMVMAGFLFLSKRSLVSANYFIRYFPAHLYSRSFTLNLNLNSFYIAGATETRAYLANYTAPSKILCVDQFASDSTLYNFSFDNNISLSQSYSTFIDSPFIYLFDGIFPQVLRARFSNYTFSRILVPDLYFSSSCALAMDSNNFVMRRFDKQRGRNIFICVSDTSKRINLFPAVLQKQVDGLFCTDGSLSKDNFSKRFLYTYFYRNEYMLLDSNLKVINRYHTIDTTSRANIKISQVSSDHSTTFSAPPGFINLGSSFTGNWLVVQSPVKAKNETTEMFTGNTVLDCYTLSDNKYHFSIHIPDIDHQKVNSFKISGNKLYVIQGNYFTVYHLSFISQDR